MTVFFFGNNKNGDEYAVEASLLKILLVKRVVPYLYHCPSLEFLIGSFVFQDKYYSVNDGNNICTAAHARDVIFKIDTSMSRIWRKNIL